MDEFYPGWSEQMELSFGQELNGFLYRRVENVLDLVASATRPLRERLNLTRSA